MKPIITIFMPAFNREKYLAGTVESLLKQTFGDFELIIADDGSTDRTLELARSYAEKDARVKVISLTHQGEVAARNEAIRQKNPDSKYLLNHDSDDLSMTDKLMKLVRYLEIHPEIAIVGSFAEYFNDAGQFLGQPKLEYEPARIRATFGQLNSMIHSAHSMRSFL
jgi:glycosyltransferase involved in cell wall biosynthesis